MKFSLFSLGGVAVGLLVGTSAHAVIHTEVEPNNSVANAQYISNFEPNDEIIGELSPAASDRDYFRLNIAQQPFAIYRTTLYAGGRGQPSEFFSAGLVMYRNNIPIDFYDRYSFVGDYRTRYYHFGKSMEVNVGIVTSSADSRLWGMSLLFEAVTPTDLGQFQAGEFRFRDGAPFSDTTSIAIYDAQGNLVPGSSFTNFQSSPFDRRITLNAGRYYMPIFSSALEPEGWDPSITNSHHKLPIIMAAQSGNFSGQLRINTLTRNEVVNWNMANQTDEMLWYSFEVVPEPATMITLGAGAVAIALRRRQQR